MTRFLPQSFSVAYQIMQTGKSEISHFINSEKKTCQLELRTDQDIKFIVTTTEGRLENRKHVPVL